MSITALFGARIKELRIKAGMSQDVLASRAGLDRSYVGGIERGERNISLINIEKISNALDVDMSYLFEDERFSLHSAYLKKELKKSLDLRFAYDVDVNDNLISWVVKGVLGEVDVKVISQKLKNAALLLEKGKARLLIDNREMTANGNPFVFKPEVNECWEELQSWLLPYVQKVVVLCNSKLMKNQLDRLGKRSGIGAISNNLYFDDPTQFIIEAYKLLGISCNRLVK